jgi:hypothetical protein
MRLCASGPGRFVFVMIFKHFEACRCLSQTIVRIDMPLMPPRSGSASPVQCNGRNLSPSQRANPFLSRSRSGSPETGYRSTRAVGQSSAIGQSKNGMHSVDCLLSMQNLPSALPHSSAQPSNGLWFHMHCKLLGTSSPCLATMQQSLILQVCQWNPYI